MTPTQQKAKTYCDHVGIQTDTLLTDSTLVLYPDASSIYEIKSTDSYIDGNTLLWMYEQRKDKGVRIEMDQNTVYVRLVDNNFDDFKHAHGHFIGRKENAFLDALLRLVEIDKENEEPPVPDWHTNPEQGMVFEAISGHYKGDCFIVSNMGSAYCLITIKGHNLGSRWAEPCALSSKIFGDDGPEYWRLVEDEE